MLTKKNALPNMQEIVLKDRDGKTLSMTVEARLLKDKTYLFVSDTHQLGSSHLAKDALFFIQQMLDRFNLDGAKTEFYRHIYQETMGSMFGRFIVNWNQGSDPSYRFQMLTNVDDMVGVNKVLSQGSPVKLSDAVKRVAMG